MESKKTIIKNYIINLIVGSQLNVNEKIPTEKELMNIFGFSRIPVRNALKELTYSDWLNARHGSGYYVASNGTYESLFTKGKINAVRTAVLPLSQDDKIMLKEHNIKIIGSFKSYTKEYYDMENKMLMRTINIVSNDFLFHLSEDEIVNSFIQSLISHNVRITHQNKKVVIHEKDNVYAKKMGWNEYHPIIIGSLFCDSKNISKSIITICKKQFEFNKKIMF